MNILRKLLDYIRLAVFVLGVLIGMQIPGFIDEYGKNLSARLAESQINLQEFQKNANKFFQGSLIELFQYYETHEDPIIQASGKSLRAISMRLQRLKNASLKFNHSPFYAYFHVTIEPIPEIREQVWKNYSHNVLFTQSAIIIALIFGSLFALFLELSYFILRFFFNSIFSKTRKKVTLSSDAEFK